MSAAVATNLPNELTDMFKPNGLAIVLTGLALCIRAALP